MKMKKSRTFFRAFLISSVVLLCFCIIYIGILSSYEGIRKNGFGEDKEGIEINEDYIRILDFLYPNFFPINN